ncbi:hypothetical protein ACEWY4_015235 [Coilia grayii]|uniref:G-protein coupled receptors family 1 profile domain-containing protein n=1 Tax=Coilia grayii TaxID=363190 RepID=A0ABD1JNL5_9TELE
MRAHQDNLTTLNHLCWSNDTDRSFYAWNCAVVGITCGSGLPLNIYVVWLIIRGAGSGIGSEFFSLSLVLTDILFLTGFLMLPFINLCSIPAKALFFIYGFIAVGHPLFQTCICVERYLAVLHPVLFLKYKPLRYKLACSGVVWMMTLAASVILVLFEDIILWIFWFATYTVLFIVMLLCGLAVLRGLCKPGPGEGERAEANKVKMKAFRIISAVALTQLITIIGNMAQYFIAENTPQQQILLSLIILSTYIVTVVTHPALYLHKMGKLPCTTC